MAITELNDPNKLKYHCHNAKTCSASWTYDDWHCTGCHWKGMGLSDLKYGNAELRAEAEALRLKLASRSK